jgi:3-phosphoshikimate 1-carboxyvinyltransferase
MNPKPDLSRTLIVETYNDHRMAMAFAPLVFKVYKLAIRNPSVVEKSYPSFWRDVREAGIQQVVWDD